MTRTLITGSTGFVGKNLIGYLQSHGFQIDKLDLRTKIQTFKLNLSESVVHLAGKAHDLKNVANPSEYYEINYELTKRLYDLFLDSTAKKFIFISSVKASADHVQGVLKETDSPDPLTDYGKSKLMAEEYIANCPVHNGKQWFILRPCMIYGPGNKGNLNLLYKFITKGIPYPLGAFENSRSFLSVENLCFVIEEILRRDDIGSGIYNIADDEALSTNELIMLIAKAASTKPVLWKANPNVIQALAKLGDLIKLPLNSERLKKLTESYVVDNRKIREALHKELPVKSRDGIVRTILSLDKLKGPKLLI